MEHFVKEKKPNARETALFILNTLDRTHKTLDRILEDILEENELSRRDRSLVHVLVYGVLRWRGHLNWLIGRFSRTPLNRIEPRILNILRLGLFQIVYLDKIPVSAAVNTSVEMAKTFAAPWVLRFVNALLRNAAREYEKVSFPDADKDPLYAMSVEKSFPKWLIERWAERFGIEETGKLCDAVNAVPPITVRANTLKISRDALIKAIGEDAGQIQMTYCSADGLSFFNPKIAIPEMKAFKEGWFQVQDEAAQRVTLLLDPQPGESVLDACAGLGGKTGHIAQQMKNQGHIVAADHDERKLSRLKSEMERLGVSIVTTCIHDLNNHFNSHSSLITLHLNGFDRVLLDAPCSGLGVLRRNPDAKWSVSKKDLARCRERQIKFMNNLAGLVKLSGIFVYAVCSTEPEENEEVIRAFLEKHPEFETESEPLKTFPHIDNMDGFFSVRMKKRELTADER